MLWIFCSQSVVCLFILLRMMSFDEWKFLIWVKFIISACFFTFRKTLCFGFSLSALGSQATGCSVLTCRSLLPHWLARASLGGGYSISDLFPLWPQALEAGTVTLLGDSLPAISSQESFPRSLCISHSSLRPTPGSSTKQRWPTHLIKSFLALVMPPPPHPTLTGDLWHSLQCPLGKGTRLKISTLLDYNIKLLFTSDQV